MSKSKFYVVWEGRNPGVYDSWEACKKEVESFPGALYKGYPDQASAEEAQYMPTPKDKQEEIVKERNQKE